MAELPLPVLVPRKPSFSTQFITAAAATLGGMSMGTAMGFSSPASVLLLSNSTVFSVTEEEISWFSASLSLGAIAGAPIGGLGLNYIGRKGTVLFASFPFLLSWILMIFSTNTGMLISARIIGGMSCSLSCLSVPTYIAEFSSAEIRGLLGSLYQLMVNVGIMYAYVMGAIIHDWQLLSLSCIVPPVAFGISMTCMKESPAFLVIKGQVEEAAVSLQHFRGQGFDTSGELGDLKAHMKRVKSNKASLKELTSRHILMPLFISVILLSIQQFSGINAVLFNLTSIFNAAKSTIRSDISSIIVGALQVVFAVLGAILVDKAGRRLLLLVSTAVMAACLGSLGIYFWLEEAGTRTAVDIGWLPLTCLILLVIFYAVGFGPIPWLMMGELLPQSVREVASTMATMSNWLAAFIVTAIFTPLKNSIGDAGIYWFFAGWCTLSFFFCLVFVVETKGKTLDEISALFQGPAASARKTQENLIC